MHVNWSFYPKVKSPFSKLTNQQHRLFSMSEEISWEKFWTVRPAKTVSTSSLTTWERTTHLRLFCWWISPEIPWLSHQKIWWNSLICSCQSMFITSPRSRPFQSPKTSWKFFAPQALKFWRKTTFPCRFAVSIFIPTQSSWSKQPWKLSWKLTFMKWMKLTEFKLVQLSTKPESLIFSRLPEALWLKTSKFSQDFSSAISVTLVWLMCNYCFNVLCFLYKSETKLNTFCIG